MAMKVENFKLYVSRNNKIFIPYQDHTILVLVENADQGASFIPKLPLTKKMLFAYSPRMMRVYNKIVRQDFSSIRSNYGKGINLFMNTSSLKGKSFYYDITPYFKSLQGRLSTIRFAKEGLKFFKNVVDSVKEINKETVLLYYVDETILPQKIREKELFSFIFSYNLRKNIIDLGIDKIFLTIKDSARLVYDREQSKANKFTIFLKWIFQATKKKTIISIEDDIQSIEQDQKEEFKDLLEIEPEEIVQADSGKNKDVVIPPKIEAKPLSITSRDIRQASMDIIKNNMSDLNRLNINLDTAMSRLQAFANSNPIIAKNVVKSYVKDDAFAQKQIVQAALAQAEDPESALLTQPTKHDLTSVSKQEKEARKLGLTQILPIDTLHKPNLQTSMNKNHIAHSIARRYKYQDKLVSTLKRSLPKPLSEIGYELLDVTFSDVTTQDTELFQTQIEHVNIKCKKPDGQNITLKFKVPKLTENRYVLSGGLKWYYPTVLSTLPIFIVKPGYVQFRSNYSAISFTYGLFNRREDIRCYTGGFKIPMSLLLSCLLSVEGVLKEYKLNYFMSEKKKKDNCVSLPMEDGTFLVVERKADTLSKIIISGLEQMWMKYKPKTINNVREAFEALKQYTKQNKSEYNLKQMSKYIVDVQTYDVLREHKLPTELIDIIKHCAELAISGESDDKLAIHNTYLRTTDIIASGVEQGIHAGISIYKQQRIYSPETPLKVNVGHVINYFREQGVLQMLEQQNPVEEISGYASVKIVGPGGLPNRDAVQPKDRSMRPSHFGNLDPIDTSEGDPGIKLYLTTGHIYDDEKHSFMTMDSNDENKDILGLTTSLSPFVDKDDQARLNMACNQARQTVPIVQGEEPMILTGSESLIPALTSTTFTKRATKDGTVTHIDDNVIIMKYEDGTKEAIDIRPTQLKSGSGIDSAITHTPSVRVGDQVKRNRMLTRNEFLKPILAQGINVKCAYLSYLGYNYEDGIVLSESLAKKLTSLHYDTVEIELTEKDRLSIFPTIGQTFEKGETISVVKRNLVGDISLTEDYEIIAPARIKIVDIDIYPKHLKLVSDILTQVDSAYKETNEKLREQGLPLMFDKQKIINNVGKYTKHGDKMDTTSIVIKMLRYMPVELGDKLTNRHAAKGVVAHIVPDHLMPVTEDGERMDILINVLSVVSRMNLGQMYEVIIGKILYFAVKKVIKLMKTDNYRNKIENFLIELYDLLDGTANKEYSSETAKNIQSLSDQEFKKFIFGVANGKLHLVVPPFRSPTNKQIYEALKLVETTMSDMLLLPEINSKTKNPVCWGIMYITKLEHISSVKQNVRNLGPYIKTTLEPTRGKARAGGQRMGEMDSWCLLSYDANTVLSDFWLVNADNPEAKKQVISEIYKNGKADITFDINRSGAGQFFDSILLCMGVDPKG